MKLGNVVEKLFYITGIKWLWEKIWGPDCNTCRKRKEWMNREGPTVYDPNLKRGKKRPHSIVPEGDDRYEK